MLRMMSGISMLYVDATLNRCCGGGDAGMGCGGYVGGKPALDWYKDGLFGDPRITTWTRGQSAEVFWASGANHMGGYAYRLCKVNDGKFWEVTEECFNKGHLNFSGTVSYCLSKTILMILCVLFVR